MRLCSVFFCLLLFRRTRTFILIIIRFDAPVEQLSLSVCLSAKAGFQVLFILSMPEYTQPTMSFLADEMGITKQQLTKLVNDLEAMGLVKRIHDERNRRQVYVTLTDDGRNEFEEIKQAMLECTVAGLKDFSEDELEQLGDCLERLIPLLEKFRGNC